MIWLIIPLAILIGYLLGSLPVGLIVGRAWGVDVRSVGSGRTGTTNVGRAAGPVAGAITLIGDAIKGAVAIWIIQALYPLLFPEPTVMSVEAASTRVLALQLAEALAGGAAIIGHNWSIFMGFHGGAGGITSAATTMALSPLVGGSVWLIGAFLIWWSRISSVGTYAVGASAFALFLVLGLNEVTPWPYILYGVIALFSVTVALSSNREKIRKQEERINTRW
jgi:acyl phosphate:glycerol-3-phosphate acyltransferase